MFFRAFIVRFSISCLDYLGTVIVLVVIDGTSSFAIDRNINAMPSSTPRDIRLAYRPLWQRLIASFLSIILVANTMKGFIHKLERYVSIY